MSHIVTITAEIRDIEALRSACRRLELAPPQHGEAELYSGKCTGQIVQLPEWRYPVVCDTRTGVVRYDNYQGRWGDEKQLNRLVQYYVVEKTRLEARRYGRSVSERQLHDGSIRLVVSG